MTSAIDGQDKPVLRPKEIAERIERDIHVGTLAPGAWLKQVDLEERYGCTRIDLRQALDRLVTRQLVRHTPNRGYRVDEFEPRKVEELRSEEHTSELQSLMRISYAVFCLKKKKN